MFALFADWRFCLSALIGICVAAGLALGCNEIAWLRRKQQLDRARVREMLLSLSPLPVNVVITFALAGAWAAIYMQAHRLAPIALPVNFASMAIALLAVDLSYYWEHRCAHRLPWLWGLYHAIHHSSEDYTIATAYRVSGLTQLLAPAFYLPWVVLGFHPLLVLGWQLFAFHYQAWLHTEMIGELGALDRWFNTPAAHRVHHSKAEQHRDRNLGAVTLLWDRLFGTFAPPAMSVSYGIPGMTAPGSVVELYTSPWRRWLRWPAQAAARESR